MFGAAVLLVFLLSAAVIPDVRSSVDPKHNSIRGYMHRAHRKRECLEQPLDDRVRHADVIFTGTIRRLEPDSNNPESMLATVEVKRFIKGDEQDSSSKSVTLSGIGDDSPGVCQNWARRQDSWIFLASQPRAGASDVIGVLRLNSSLVRMTLDNIDNIEAAVRRYEKLHSTHRPTIAKTRPTAEVLRTTTSKPIDPCSLVSCSHGAVCVSDDGITVRCQCPTVHCSDADRQTIVCGSDGNEYGSNCEMKAASCREQRHIAKKYDGHCDSCHGKQCNFHAVCVADNRGGSQCVCPTENSCRDEQKAGSSSSSRVCGSDGSFHASECEMRVTSCRQSVLITRAPNRQCDRCADVVCGRRGEHCVDGECVCRTDCSVVYEPVCGSNSVTYPNQCKLDEVACTDNLDIETVNKGQCIDDDGSADDVQVLPATDNMMSNKQVVDERQPARPRCDDKLCSFGAICETIGHSYHCVCRFNCDAVRSSVCGSDGNIYTSECQMMETACRKQTDLTVQPIDNCQDVDMVEFELCDGRQPLINGRTGVQYNCNDEACPAGSYCHRPQQSAVARCCPASEEAVRSCELSEFGCCSDGVTAALGHKHAGCPDKCQCNTLGATSLTCDPETQQCRCKKGVGGLRCDRCEASFWGMHQINSLNAGCKPCGCNVFGSVRDDCHQMTGRCLCQPGFTGLKCSICPNGAHVGSQGCSGIDIMHNDEPPVAKQHHRRQQQQPTIASSASDTSSRTCSRRCSHGSVCDVSSGHAPRCRCPHKCDDDGAGGDAAVCGTDGQTYRSLCHLRLHSCRRQQRIRVAHRGHC